MRKEVLKMKKKHVKDLFDFMSDRNKFLEKELRRLRAQNEQLKKDKKKYINLFKKKCKK